MTHLCDILIGYRGFKGCSECTGQAAVIEAAELGFHELIVDVDLHVEVVRGGRLEVLDHDCGRGTEGKRRSIRLIDNALTN